MHTPRLTRPSLALAALVAAFAGASAASGQVRIIGYLSNFDVPNETEHECNEFEFELEGPHVEDVYHTYHNGNYGAPTITALPGNIGIRIVYDTPHHATAPGAIEHFGVSITPGHPITAQRFNWVIGGLNPPYPPPPPPPPPPPLAMPLIESEVIYLPTGAVLRQTVTNIDPLGRVIWVQRREIIAPREVALEELMPNDPLIQEAVEVDEGPERLLINEPLVIEEDGPRAGDLNSAVIVYDVFSNRRVLVGGEMTDAPGPLITCLLTASVAVGDNCPQQFLPTFTLQPESVTTVLDAAVYLYSDATGLEGYDNVSFQWKHEGVDIPGAHDTFLELDPIRPEDAGAYTVVIMNDCGFVSSQSAFVTINYPPPCPADYDHDGAINSSDFFDFLADFFDSRGNADLDLNLQITSQDFFLFLSHFFSGC